MEERQPGPHRETTVPCPPRSSANWPSVTVTPSADRAREVGAWRKQAQGF